MRRGAALLLLVLFAVAAVPGHAAAQDAASADERPLAELPKSYRDCAAAFRRKAGESDSATPFGCTRAYYESLPGSNGSTYDMGRAAARAAEAGDLYIDSILTPEISQGLEPDPDRAGSRRLTRDFLLRGYLRSARAAGEALCDIYYDYHSEGTIRSVVAGSCAVSNRDRLIGELLTLAAMITAQEG